jgi:hypothetical protein
MTDESCISEMISVSEFLARPLGITKYFLYFMSSSLVLRLHGELKRVLCCGADSM